MAVYYKWIKGCEAGAKLANSEGQSDAGLWTYLKWGSGNTGVEQMPSLKANIGKDDTTQTKDFGYFLTSKMPMPLIQTDLRTNKTIYFIDTNYTTENQNFNDSAQHRCYTWMQQGQDTFTIQGCSGKDGTTTINEKIVLNSNEFFVNKSGNYQVFKVNSYDKRFTDGIDMNAKVTIYDPEEKVVEDTTKNILLDVRGAFVVGRDKSGQGTTTAFFPVGDSEESIIFNKKLEVENQSVDAQYFNATSDKRAKENIQPATYNALELIKKLPVYTYNYKNKSENVTGILAQDLLEAQPKELDLVSNINATGENNDYMSIKNDKLMFVLMKAIQEQQEQIEKLQSEIEKLKNI